MAMSPAIFSGPGARGRRRKREYVRGLVLATEASIEAADRFVGGEQNSDLAGKTDRGLGFSKEMGQGASRGQALIDRCCRRTALLHRFCGRRRVRVQICVEENHGARNAGCAVPLYLR